VKITIYLHLLISIIFSLASSASEIGKIYFPAEKNGARLLFQKLEYQVINDDSIKLGNLLINSNDVKIEIAKTSEDKPLFAFWGPAQMIKNATLLIRDPTGRSIWSYKIKNKELEEPTKTKTSENPIQSNLAVFRLKKPDAQMITSLSNTIFFNFCIFYEDENHRHNLCSKDYRLERSKKGWDLSLITRTKKDYIVQVNGTEVGQEGLVQISDKISNISFSARLASGFLLELRTGNIPIEIIDSKWESESDFAELTIREKNLNDKFNLRRAWVSKVLFNQSYFYLEGESQIPLKQEIVFDEKPPSEKVRPKLMNNNFKTYSESLSLDLKMAPETKIKAKTNGDTVNNRKAVSTWNLNKISMEGSNTHAIEITNQDKKYLATYEVLRGLPWLTKIGLNLSQANTTTGDTKITPMTGNGFDFDLTYHSSSFLGINADWAQLRWLVDINTKSMSYKSNEGSLTKIQDSSIDFGYRFSYGFHHETPSAGLLFGYYNRKIDSQTASSPTLGFFYKNPMIKIPGIGELIYLELKSAPSLSYSPSESVSNMMKFKY
jgi:hypothetical protein